MRFLWVLLFVFISSCATTSDDESNSDSAEGSAIGQGEQVNQEGQTTGYQDSGNVNGSALSDEQKYSMQELSNPNSPLSIRTIYFGYDSSQVASESHDVLVEHAKFLSFNPGVQVVLEGHTDERGTRDYNLALGEGRSKSVHEFLTTQGVNSQQLEIVSFGEERPVALEHDDTAWQLNRRVEILYPSQ